jgi:hypothetical protein
MLLASEAERRGFDLSTLTLILSQAHSFALTLILSQRERRQT